MLFRSLEMTVGEVVAGVVVPVVPVVFNFATLALIAPICEAISGLTSFGVVSGVIDAIF